MAKITTSVLTDVPSSRSRKLLFSFPPGPDSPGARPHLHASLLEIEAPQLPDPGLFTFHQALATVHQGYVDTKTGQESRSFDAHGAAADHHGPLWQSGGGEGFPVGPGGDVFCPFKVGDDGFGAGGR